MTPTATTFFLSNPGCTGDCQLCSKSSCRAGSQKSTQTRRRPPFFAPRPSLVALTGSLADHASHPPPPPFSRPQVGTYDQFRESYRALGVTAELPNTFLAAMTSGLIYSVITMPLETAKNRMAFQKPLADGSMQFRSATQTITDIVRREGVAGIYAGFPPYYLRCGGHTVLMFVRWVPWHRELLALTAICCE